MEATFINMKILLPFKIFAEIKNVTRIVLITNNGSFGLLIHRLDCTAALVPGILEYETETEGTNYIAIDAGVLVKKGFEVIVSVRNAFNGTDLGKLHELVEKEFLNLDEREKDIRSVMAKIESGFIRQFEKFSKQ